MALATVFAARAAAEARRANTQANLQDESDQQPSSTSVVRRLPQPTMLPPRRAVDDVLCKPSTYECSMHCPLSYGAPHHPGCLFSRETVGGMTTQHVEDVEMGDGAETPTVLRGQAEVLSRRASHPAGFNSTVPIDGGDAHPMAQKRTYAQRHSVSISGFVSNTVRKVSGLFKRRVSGDSALGGCDTGFEAPGTTADDSGADADDEATADESESFFNMRGQRRATDAAHPGHGLMPLHRVRANTEPAPAPPRRLSLLGRIFTWSFEKSRSPRNDVVDPDSALLMSPYQVHLSGLPACEELEESDVTRIRDIEAGSSFSYSSGLDQQDEMLYEDSAEVIHDAITERQKLGEFSESSRSRTFELAFGNRTTPEQHIQASRALVRDVQREEKETAREYRLQQQEEDRRACPERSLRGRRLERRGVLEPSTMQDEDHEEQQVLAAEPTEAVEEAVGDADSFSDLMKDTIDVMPDSYWNNSD